MIENDNDFLKILNKAMAYLSYQPRSILDIKKFLHKKKYNHEIINKVIGYLIEKDYLNDTSYAKFYIESKVKTKPKSVFAFGYDLKKKGIGHSIFDPILRKYDDHKLAKMAIAPKIKHWYNYDDDRFKRKIMNFLQYRGFSYDICSSTLDYYCSVKERRSNNEDGH